MQPRRTCNSTHNSDALVTALISLKAWGPSLRATARSSVSQAASPYALITANVTFWSRPMAVCHRLSAGLPRVQLALCWWRRVVLSMRMQGKGGKTREKFVAAVLQATVTHTNSEKSSSKHTCYIQGTIERNFSEFVLQATVTHTHSESQLPSTLVTVRVL